MATTNKWIETGMSGRETIHNVQIGMTVADVNSMVDLMISPPTEHLIFGDYSKWCSNLVFFPMDIKRNSATVKMVVGGANTNTNCFNIPINSTFGYTLGEYYYRIYNNDFTDYEPYTTLQIYLPYYGFVDIPISDVIGKYIQFRLMVDFMTGQAMYTIGVNDNSVYSPNAPYKIGTDDSETRIISTNVFQLGTSVPLGQTGMAEAIRNISMAAIKGAGVIAASAISSGLGSGVETTTTSGGTVTTVTTYDRFGSGNRPLKTKGNISKTTTESPTTKTVDRRGYARGNRISETFSTATNALSNMALRPSIDKPNNSFVDVYGCRSIKIIRKTSKVIPINQNYGKLYGYPLGETRKLSNVKGYSEITSIHFEGEGFENATQAEMALLKDAFSEGVIFPSLSQQGMSVTNLNSHESYSFTMPYGYTFEQFIGSSYDTSGGRFTIQSNSGYVLFDGYSITYNDEPVLSYYFANKPFLYEGIPDSQTITIINLADQKESSFTMPYGYTFNQLVGSQYDKGDRFSIQQDSGYVLYDGYLLTLDGSNLSKIYGSDVARGTFYYYGEITMQTLTVINSNTVTETESFTMPSGWDFYQFVGSEYDTSGGAFTISTTEKVAYRGYTLRNSDNIAFDTTKASGIFYYAGESVYTLSGTWVFNEHVDTAIPEVVQQLDFTSFLDLTVYSSISSHNDGNRHQYVMYDDTYAYLVGDNVDGGWSDGWLDEDFRYIRIHGTQTVSKNFYDWFTANATPYYVGNTLDGGFIFNDYINVSSLARETNIINVNFTDFRGNNYDSIKLIPLVEGAYNNLYYVNNGEEVKVYDAGGDVWTNDYYKEIYFNNQNVPNYFYNWIYTNAQPKSGT